MKIKLSQYRMIEIKTKWLIWGFVMVFIVLPIIPPLFSALWTQLDESICNQDQTCRRVRNSAKVTEQLKKDMGNLK